MRTDGRIRTPYLDWASLLLVIVGAINWGLVGVGAFLDANWNLVNLVFGAFPAVESLIYVLVGLAGGTNSTSPRNCTPLAPSHGRPNAATNGTSGPSNSGDESRLPTAGLDLFSRVDDTPGSRPSRRRDCYLREQGRSPRRINQSSDSWRRRDRGSRFAFGRSKCGLQ